MPLRGPSFSLCGASLSLSGVSCGASARGPRAPVALSAPQSTLLGADRAARRSLRPASRAELHEPISWPPAPCPQPLLALILLVVVVVVVVVV
jgi:hypothetical protein